MSGFCPARRGVSVVSVDVGPGVVPAGRVIGAARGVPVSEEPGVVLVDNDINAVRGVVPADGGPGFGVGGRGRYTGTLSGPGFDVGGRGRYAGTLSQSVRDQTLLSWSTWGRVSFRLAGRLARCVT